MKYFVALLTLAIVVIALVFLETSRQHDNDAPPAKPPWQVEILAGKDTQVFGITPGWSTLDQAVDELGEDLELAIIAAPGETGSLEAYYSHYIAGPVTGKIILVMDVDPDKLLAMRERATRDGGTRRYYLQTDDLQAAYQAPVKVITFLPSINLDEEIAQARFGAPAEVIEIDARQKHLLYPNLGLDLILNTDGKDILQYLSPRDFDAHRSRIKQSITTQE